MEIRISKIQLDDIIVFMLLFLSVGFVVSNDIIPSIVTIALWIGLGFLIVIRGISLNIPIFCVTIVSLILMLFTNILTNQNLFVFVKHAFAYFIVMLYVSNTSFERFSKAFTRVVRFFCIISLVGYSLHIIMPQIFEFNVVSNVKGFPFSNYFIYVQWMSGGFNALRNWGFAWEPGAFATIICLALMIEIFVIRENISIKNIVLYAITVFSTMSTMGIVALMCLCLYITVGSTTISKRTRISIAITEVLCIILVLLFSSVFFDLSNNSVFGKIIRFINSNGQGNVDSVSVRLYSVTEVFRAFLRRPLFGWGYIGLSEETAAFTHGMNTCTFLNWFAVYGCIYGVLMIVGITNFAKQVAQHKNNWIVILVFLFAITMTEDYVHCSLFFLLILYGYYYLMFSRETCA